MQTPGFVNFVAAVASHFYLALPAAIIQHGARLLAKTCRLSTAQCYSKHVIYHCLADSTLSQNDTHLVLPHAQNVDSPPLTEAPLLASPCRKCKANRRGGNEEGEEKEAATMSPSLRATPTH